MLRMHVEYAYVCRFTLEGGTAGLADSFMSCGGDAVIHSQPWLSPCTQHTYTEAALITKVCCAACFSVCLLQLGESLEEQLGQRLLRMPPPPQLPPRVRQGQQHSIEQQQQPSMFQLPYELPPVLTDPMQVGCCGALSPCQASVSNCMALHTGPHMLCQEWATLQPFISGVEASLS